MPVFDSLLTKLSQVNLSDINHELGKAKESLVFESGAAMGSFREAASQGKSLIRSESTRFGSFLGGSGGDAGLPKSTSMPHLSPAPSSKCRPCRSKYKYRSSNIPSDNLTSPESLLHEESVVDRFIKVVGADDDRGGVKGERKGMRTSKSSSSPTANSTREDIRKKLASWGEEEEDEDGEEEVENNNLEICFFNETASDDEEEVTRNPLEEEEEEEDYFEEERSGGRGMSRSKSEGFSLRGDPLLLQPESNQASERESRRKRQLQNSARLALAQCSSVARRQVSLERQERNCNSRLHKLLGVNDAELTPRLLSTYNINTLQVIVNDFRERIEQYNGELVQMLIEKDELQQEQEGVLMDIEDLGCEE